MYNGLEVRVPFCDYRMEEYLYGVPLGIQGLPLIRKKPAEGNHEGIPAGKNSMAQEKSLPKDAPSGIFSCSVESARRTGVGRLRTGLADRPPRLGGRPHQCPGQSTAVVRTIDDHAADDRLSAAGQLLVEKVQCENCVILIPLEKTSAPSIFPSKENAWAEIFTFNLDSRKHDDAIVEKNAVNAENSLF